MSDETDRILELEISQDQRRVDKFLAEAAPDLSRSRVQRLIEEGRVTVNGVVPKASDSVQAGDRVRVRVPPQEQPRLIPQDIPLDVVYEDEQLIVVNKPAGMVVHPAYGHPDGTLINAVLGRYPELGEVDNDRRPGIVHRLDKDTSGVILVARSGAAQRHLQRQFKRREVQKVYVVLLEGQIEPEHALIDAPLGRDPDNRKRMAVVWDGGRQAQTEYEVIEYFDEHTLVEARPVTGRTHQIRVHFSSLDHPVVGDPVYGFRKGSLNLQRQFLHAKSLAFTHPATGRRVQVQADLPRDLEQILSALRKRSRR